MVFAGLIFIQDRFLKSDTRESGGIAMRRLHLLLSMLVSSVLIYVAPAWGTLVEGPLCVGTSPGLPTTADSVTIEAWCRFSDTGESLNHVTCTRTGNIFSLKIYMNHLTGNVIPVEVEGGGSYGAGPLAAGHYVVNAELYFGAPPSTPSLTASGEFDVVTARTTSSWAVTNFTAIEGYNSATLSWQNPTNPGFVSTTIRYDMNGYPQSVTEGQLLCTRTGAPGSSDSYTHVGNNDGHRYYYSVFTNPANPMPCAQTSAIVARETTIAAAKGLQYANAWRLRGNVVSAVCGDYFYIQDPVKPWGIKVIGPAPSPGQTVDILGTPNGYGSERCIDCRGYEIAVVDPSQSTLPIAAIGNLALGGSTLNTYSPGVYGGQGANNLGLLVRTWGKVTQRDRLLRYFYIDDGSNLRDGTTTETSPGVSEPSVGVRVQANPTSYPKGCYVAVTGVSSSFWENNVSKRQILPTSAGVAILRQ